jgi:hypothetical protein
MNAKISLVTIVIAVCLSVSASSAPDPELNRPIASDNAKPATLLPALVWNPHNLPAGDSLYQTLIRGNYEASLTTDLAAFTDSISNYHLFVMAGIEEYSETLLTYTEFHPLLPVIQGFLAAGGACYWEGAVAYTDINYFENNALYNYFLAFPLGTFGNIVYLSGENGTPFSDIDSLEYEDSPEWTHELDSGWSHGPYVLNGYMANGYYRIKGVIGQVGLTRTMLTNFSWARLNDSGINNRVDLIGDVMEWLSGAVAVEEPEPLPQAFSLSPPYPNPFNAQVTIEYALPNEAAVLLSLFDIQGRKVATLTEGTKPAGFHRLIWDAKEMPSGMYFVRLKAGEFTETRKMTLVK